MKFKALFLLFIISSFPAASGAKWSAEGGPRPELTEDIQTRLSMSIGIFYNLFTPDR